MAAVPTAACVAVDDKNRGLARQRAEVVAELGVNIRPAQERDTDEGVVARVRRRAPVIDNHHPREEADLDIKELAIRPPNPF